MKTSESIELLTADFVKAQGQMKPVEKTGVNPKFGSAYSTIKGVMDAVQKPLADNNLSILQFPEAREGKAVLITRLQHGSGQFFETEVEVETVGEGPQPFGSCVTYLRRYAVMAICGLAPDDDDANQAQEKAKAREAFISKKGGGADGPTAPKEPKPDWIGTWRLKPEILEQGKAAGWKIELRDKKDKSGKFEVMLVPGPLVSSCIKGATPAPAAATSTPAATPAAPPSAAPQPTKAAPAPAAPPAAARGPVEAELVHEDPICWCQDPLSAHDGHGRCGAPECGCLKFETVKGSATKPAPGPATTAPTPQKASYEAAKEFRTAINSATTPNGLDFVAKGIAGNKSLQAADRNMLNALLDARRKKIAAPKEGTHV